MSVSILIDALSVMSVLIVVKTRVRSVAISGADVVNVVVNTAATYVTHAVTVKSAVMIRVLTVVLISADAVSAAVNTAVSNAASATIVLHAARIHVLSAVTKTEDAVNVVAIIADIYALHVKTVQIVAITPISVMIVVMKIAGVTTACIVHLI
jgi:hypothetical protein